MDKSETIYRDSIADQIFKSLIGKISDGELMPHDRLPGEDNLAKEYRVSRMTVRMAIQKLKALGMVETVGGGGTYVKQFSFPEVIGNLSGPMSKRVLYGDILQFRIVIESEVLFMVCSYEQKPEDIEYLRECYRRMEEAINSLDKNELAKADYAFHLQTCVMSRNTMFSFAYEMLGSVITGFINRMSDMEKETCDVSHGGLTYKEVLDIHQRIIDAIVTRNPEEIIAMYNRGYKYKD